MEVTGAECLPHTYQELLDYLGQLEYGATGGYRQWIYQTCTEFGWYQSSDQPGHPYGTKFPVDFSVKVKFIYSEKATKFCKISTLLLSYVVPVKSKVEILQNLWPS